MKATIIQKERMKKYYRSHKDDFLARNTTWQEKNRDKYLDSKRKYYESHKEKHKQWRIINREKWLLQHRVQQQRRRSLLKDLTVELVQEIYEKNIKKYGTLTCALCLKKISFGEDSIDHKYPLSKGGSNKKENLQVAHRICNGRKSNKIDWEFI